LKKAKQPSSLHMKQRRVLLLSDMEVRDIDYFEALRNGYTCTVAAHIEDYFKSNRNALLPHVVLLDYYHNTYELLMHISNYMRRKWKYNVPTIIIQREGDEALYGRLIERGQRDILRAPFRIEELLHRIDLNVHWGERNRLSAQVHDLNSELYESYMAMIFSLAELTEARDNSTGNHLQRIRQYSLLLAEKVRARQGASGEIDESFINRIYHMSALHDIGKVGIPDHILLKAGPLTPEERRTMETHTILGGQTIESVLSRYSISDGFAMARDIAYYHHERWDGEGYPYELKGEDIPLAARIVGIVDVYDALSVQRVYKRAYDPQHVKSIMETEQGCAFDPELLQVFLDHWDHFEQIRTALEAVRVA
ncbi:MAG: HD-GYP domain-containing protein, partial [Spirochaetota bacterium]